MNRMRLGLFVLMLAVLLPVMAHADGASAWYSTAQGRVRLIAATPAVSGASEVRLGLEFELAPHWKIYWRSPGDAGYPPHLDWAGSQNLKSAVMSWPAPERFSVLGLETVGYTDAVVLPIAARLDHRGAPLHLAARLRYLTCNDICVPHETNLTLDLPAQGGGTAYAGLIAQYAAQVPGDGKAAGLDLDKAVLRGGQTPMLELQVTSRRQLVAPDAFLETPQAVTFGAPIAQPAHRDGQDYRTVLRVPVQGDWAALIGRKLTVTLVDGARAMTGTIVPVQGAALVDLAMLLPMFGLALLGGLILNLMPCVLPVLALKLLAVLPKDGQSRAALRRGLIVTAAGVILSFLLLALAVMGLKQAGLAVGWGVQFQDPLFLAFLIVVLTLFAANLWGFFEVPLPRAVADAGGRSDLGNFATGVFATLLATPCSAPFLGTALGFALSAGPFEIFAIFLGFGIGMAAPYLLGAAAPVLVAWLPRPGHWMVHLRRALGLLLAASAAWLLWVLSAEIGVTPSLIVAGLMIVIAVTLAFLREAGPRRATLAVAVLGALAVASLARLASPPRSVETANALWHRFDPAAIGALVHDGDVVFVDVSADWCLTCKLNERLVLDASPVRAALAHSGVVAMRADWTRPNVTISDYLSRYGRYGIPFNAVYGPAAPGGLALPELLTQNDVTTALARAAGR